MQSTRVRRPEDEAHPGIVTWNYWLGRVRFPATRQCRSQGGGFSYRGRKKGSSIRITRRLAVNAQIFELKYYAALHNLF
jgi:hypothetical protein